MLNLIRSQPGIKARELADQAAVSQRTIHRDILTLSSHYMVVNDKGYRVAPSAYLKTMGFTQEEYDALQLALSCPALQQAAEVRSAAKSAKAKIDTVVNPDLLKSRPAVYSFVRWASSPSESDLLKLICSKLTIAIKQKKAVDLALGEYSGFDRVRVWPYQLACDLPDWHLVALLPKTGQFCVFKLAEIEKVLSVNQTFERDAKLNMSEIFGTRWPGYGGEKVAVKVEFKGRAARAVLSQTNHAEEKIVKTEDGKILFSAKIRSPDGFLNWLLGFGLEAKILAPQLLKDKMKEKVAALYEFHCQSFKKAGVVAKLPEMDFSDKKRGDTGKAQPGA
ncbi:MAG: WYL domain-containing protein [candidate division Zixibacteria bacterium]|nr:WYL domain-containing protein [candidate division Zixibacteria bacterium]